MTIEIVKARQDDLNEKEKVERKKDMLEFIGELKEKVESGEIIGFAGSCFFEDQTNSQFFRMQGVKTYNAIAGLYYFKTKYEEHYI